MEGMIDDNDESSNEGWRRWDNYEITNHDNEYKNEHGDEKRHELCDDATQEMPICTIRRFKMIKYLFGKNEEYVTVKEGEYEDLTSISEDACRAYQEIFHDGRRMDGNKTRVKKLEGKNSEVHNDKTCSETCLKSFETLKTQLDELRIEFNKSEFNLATYKRGLASVEEQLVFYKKNEVIFYEQLVVLKRDISYKDSKLSVLKSKLEKLKQEKESNQLKIENFDNASKSLEKLIGSQLPDKSRKGLGFVSYNVVAPPPTGLFSPLNLDLSNSGLEEFQQPEFEGYGPKTSKNVSEDTSNEVRSQSPRGNQRNWNNQKSQQLGSNFVMYNKACFVCGSFDHVQAHCNYHQRERVESRNNYTRVKSVRPQLVGVWRPTKNLIGHPQKEYKGYVDSGCSRHMTGNMSYLSDFKEFDGGYVTFGRGVKGGKITDVTMEQSSRIKLSEFCEQKGIKREFSVARTPQQNGVAERRNRTLIENKVLVVKPHNKTPYELFRVRTPALSFMRPFRCLVTILNTLDYLGKFDGKSYEGFFVGYSMNSKAFRVYNIRTRKVEENLHIRFLEDKPIIVGDGPKWLFDIDVLTKSMNYVPVIAGTNSNDLVGTKESIDAGHSSKETRSSQDYILMPLWKDKDDEGVNKESGIADQEKSENSTQGVNTVGPSINIEPDMFSLGDNATLEATHTDFFSDETEVDMSNITTTYPVPSTPNTRNHKDHSLDHVIGYVQSGVLTRRMTKTTNEQGFISEEPKKVMQELKDLSWIEAMQKELLQFKLQQVWTLMDLPHGKRAIGTKWVYRNKKDERGFEDPEFPNRVYKVEKALYGLHQALRACQDKYVDEILKKFGFLTVKIASTAMETSKPLLKDAEAKDVDVHLYRSMIVSLMYLTSLRPDIMFDVCSYARFQVTPKVLHLHVVKRIFRYLKGQPKLGLWYPKDSPFDLEAYFDSDYAGASIDKKSTTGVVFLEKPEESDGFEGIIDFLNASSIRYALTVNPTIYSSCIKQFWATAKAKIVNGEVKIQALVDGKKVIVIKKSLRRALQLKDTEAPEELGEGSKILTDPQHTPTIIQPSTSQPQKKQPRRKQKKDIEVPQPSGYTEPITDEAVNEEHVSVHSNDPLLSGGGFKKLERRNKSRTPGLKRLRKVGRTIRIESSEDEGLGAQEDASKQGIKIVDLDADAEVTLVVEAQERNDDNLMLDTGVFDEEEVEAKKVVNTAKVTTASATTTTVDELTLTQTLIEIKAAKPKAVITAATTTVVTRPKARGVVVKDLSEFTTTTSQPSQLPQAKDKDKGKMVEHEKPLKKKDQILMDEEIA
ncbi:uncharacterized mitochondrial protein-like protein [Tanacetum coccineum]